MASKDERGQFRTLVVVGLPTNGMVDIDFCVNMMNMTMPVNTSPNLKIIRGKPVDEACNLIVEHALRCNGGDGADYIYFREDDVFTPPGALERLIARDVDIISGSCMSKQIPPFPIIFKTYGGGPDMSWYDDIGDLIEVCGTGVACTLMKTEIFRHIEPPWFKTVTYPQIQKDVDDTLVGRMTQDMYFYRKAIAKGYQIWVDTGIQCGHKDTRTNTLFYFDEKLRLPAWLGPNDSEPSCIAPKDKTIRVQELSEQEREENIAEAEQMLQIEELNETDNTDELALKTESPD